MYNFWFARRLETVWYYRVKMSIQKQVEFWKKYGIYSPLIFTAVGVVVYILGIFDFNLYMKIGLGVAVATSVIWWWWTLITIIKLDKTLKQNVENFGELVGIVKDLNRTIHDSTSDRQRTKPPTDKTE